MLTFRAANYSESGFYAKNFRLTGEWLCFWVELKPEMRYVLVVGGNQKNRPHIICRSLGNFSLRKNNY